MRAMVLSTCLSVCSCVAEEAQRFRANGRQRAFLEHHHVPLWLQPGAHLTSFVHRDGVKIYICHFGIKARTSPVCGRLLGDMRIRCSSARERASQISDEKNPSVWFSSDHVCIHRASLLVMENRETSSHSPE
ncbi:hypothetical protein F4809DRAFT_597942 [Biscogniauxia mediterranea]|nr:hypothetical protein F4809DRAFT_597942 [Biscogniauxia mediterranea]